MDPQTLIEPAQTAGVPAPLWFVQFFKVLGFALHAVPMNLWYAGLLVALLLRTAGSEHGCRFSARLFRQMPVIVAFGVNLGIVPLLFVQVAYSNLFYPATILMAWFWLGIIVLLIPAYYGVYVYAAGLKEGGLGMTSWRVAVGWLSAVLFIAIGFLFANGFSLMAHVERWPELWRVQQVGGAVTGTALNVGDPSLWPRWLMMFGLALGTTAVWMVFDAAWFARTESDDYRSWATSSAWKLYALSAAWFAAAGSWYVFGTWPAETRTTMFTGPALVLTAATAVAPGLPLVLLWLGRGRRAGPGDAAVAGLAQFGVLGVNAVSRQVVQNLNIGRVFDVLGQRTEVQWGPLVMFLVAFVAGVGVVAWMIAQVVAASRQSAA